MDQLQVCLHHQVATDVTTKSYVDDLVAGLKTRIIVRAATTANVNLSML